MSSEARMNNAFKNFGEEIQVGYGSIVGQNVLGKGMFL